MTPEERTEFNEMKETLRNVVLVESVEFIENVKRRTQSGVKTDGTTATTSITIAVRNSSDDGSETVTKQPDVKLKIVDTQGNVYFLPAFNS